MYMSPGHVPPGNMVEGREERLPTGHITALLLPFLSHEKNSCDYLSSIVPLSTLLRILVKVKSL
jgi:hypothetical protein